MIDPAVIATGMMLALSGHRRPVASWLDLLGRLLGIVWIILFIIDACGRSSRLID